LTPTAAASEDRATNPAEAMCGPASTMRRNTTRADEASCTEMTLADNPVKRMHHHAYACWDSEETRHFYEDILGMPLIATIVFDDPLRDDGSRYCHTVFQIADGHTLAFFEHTSPFHPRRFVTRSGFHQHVALEVDGDAMVRQLKCRLDAAGVVNVLMDHGVFLSLRFNDPNGLVLECVGNVPLSLEYERTSRRSAHSVLRQWLHYRQNWWEQAARMK
jgi:glyoxylase I family protein